VGPGGFNDKGDIMLIQAFFLFIAAGTDFFQTGLKSRSELPVLTGIWDARTLFAVIAFQLRWIKLLVAEHSGMLFPLPGDYWIASFQQRRPTLAMMNELAWTVKGSESVTLPQAMLAAFPELRPLMRG